MADAALKPEKDFSKEADKQIPEAEKLAKVNAYTAAAPPVAFAGLLTRATHRMTLPPLSTSSQCSRSRPDRYRPPHSSLRHPGWKLTCNCTGIRSCFHVESSHRNSHIMQRGWQLESAQRPSTSSFQEAWPAQASHHQDGANCHDFHRRDTEP